MKPSTNSSSSGSVLYMAIVFMALLALLALAYTRMIPVEMNSALRFRQATLAHYVAEAGVVDSLAYIAHELKNGNEPTPSGSLTRNGTLSDWDWEATITADPQTPPFGTARLRFYHVQSSALQPGAASPAWNIRISVGEETFARFTRYVDVWPSNINYSIRTTPFVEGHVHVNDVIRMQLFSSLWGTTGTPAFNGFVTSASQDPGSPDGIHYYGPGGPPYDAGGNPIDSRYERLYRGGRAGVNTGVGRVELPDTSDGLAENAWGDATTPPTAPGVHFNMASGQIKGGAFIVGDVDQMLLGQDAGGNPQLTITQGTDTTVITEVTDAPTTSGVGIGNVEVVGVNAGVFPGTTNGLVYATGSILSLEGVNRGARLIAVDLDNDKEITITGHITRADTPVDTRPTGSRDVLGLVAYRVRLSSTIPRTYSDPLQLYLSFVAGRKGDSLGGFVVDDYANASLGTGTFRLYGAWASSRVAATGQWDGATGNQIAGFGYRQYFDPHLLTNPPPFYPTTGRLPIRSWREDTGE